MTTILLRGGRVLDPSRSLDEVTDLWIVDGLIHSIGPAADLRPDRTIQAHGLLVTPGLIDMHVHFREPGDETDETIRTGSLAALVSGFTSVACMPDTEPAVDNQASAEFITLQGKRAGHAHVWPIGAVTKARAGLELAEMGGMIDGGAVAFSDGDHPIVNADIMRRALEYAQMFDKVVLGHPEDPDLTRDGIVNEGFISTKLGIPGMPAAAEEIVVDRDIRLARWTGGRLHLQHLSCAGSVAAVRRAKESGLPITAEVCVHHLALTEESLHTFESDLKVNPPLRTETDVRALIDGVVDGTIDAVCSGHSPRSASSKLRELDAAPFGAIGLETLLPVAVKTLIEPGHLTWPGLIAKLTVNPARILGIDRGTLAPGKPADVTVIDPEIEWTVDPSTFRSRSRNCPFAGWRLKSRAHAVLVDGEIKHLVGPDA